MIPSVPDRPARDRLGRGFTLLEVIIVLVIISVLAVLALPAVSSMMREAAMREPVEQLQELAKATRLRAMLEGYPYEIIFTADGFEGRRFQLRTEEEGAEVKVEEGAEEANAEVEEGAEELAVEETQEGEDPDAAPTPALPDLVAYEFKAPMACELLFWGRTRWVEPPQADQKEQISVHDRWVFQPNGICNPLTVRFHREDAWVEIAFNPLTADIRSERSVIPD